MATPSKGVGRGVGGGAPEKYKEEFCEDIIYYFENFVGFPTLEHFAVNECKVTPKTLYNWMDKYPKFLQAVEKAQALQKHQLIQGAFSGEYNSTFSIFFAKHNCGMKDKVENEHTGLDAIKINIVEPNKKRGKNE